MFVRIKKIIFSMNKFKIHLKLFILIFSTLSLSFQTIAQDSNILHPIDDIEHRFRYEPFDIFRFRDARFKGDFTKRVILRFSDGTHIQVKWKRAKKGGEAINNQPRYELAAYELQKLFLDPGDYVVPPTIGRSLPIEQYNKLEPGVKPTFKNTSAVFFMLQYWLENVTSKDIYDKKRFKSDSVYARHFGNMNTLCYLIKHSDSNIGNILISTEPNNPRVFAVDNGLAFGNLKSDRGYEWQKVRVKRLPQKSIDGLRNIQFEDLEKALGVLAQYEIKDGQLIPVNYTKNLNPKKGVRQSSEIIQFGLTSNEIKGVDNRLKKLLKRVDSGKIQTF